MRTPEVVPPPDGDDRSSFSDSDQLRLSMYACHHTLPAAHWMRLAGQLASALLLGCSGASATANTSLSAGHPDEAPASQYVRVISKDEQVDPWARVSPNEVAPMPCTPTRAVKLGHHEWSRCPTPAEFDTYQVTSETVLIGVVVNAYGLPTRVNLRSPARDVVAKMAMRCACEHYYDSEIYGYDPRAPRELAIRVRMVK